jgi:phytanoyl-CoA dioxygenase PhyH
MGATTMIDRRAYNEHGYVLLRSFFEAAEVERIRDDAKRIFLSQMQRLGLVDGDPADEEAFARGMYALFEADLQAFTNCGKHAQHLISLHRLSLDSRIVDVLEALGLEFPTISTRPVLYFNSPRLAKKEVYNRLDAHQDWRSMQGSLDSVVVWVPLVDIDRELGALEVVPGSHVGGLLTADMEDGYGHLAEPVDRTSFVPVTIARGDALVFSTFLVHQSGNNVTDGIRWSCHFRYNNAREASFVARGLPHPYIYKPTESLITPNFPPPDLVAKVFS